MIRMKLERIILFIALFTGMIGMNGCFSWFSGSGNETEKDCLPKITTNRKTELMKAAEGGHLEAVRRFIGEGEEVNAAARLKDGSVVTAILLAAESGHSEVVRLLSESGASIGACDARKRTPIIIAVERGDPGSVQALIDAGADVNSYDGDQDLLTIAAGHGDPEIVRALIKGGAYVVLKGVSGKEPALTAAAEHGHLDIVLELVGMGANGEYSLTEAVIDQGNPEIVRALLKAGARKNELGENIHTYKAHAYAPLVTAIDKGQFEIAKVLIEEGADVNYSYNYLACSRAIYSAIRQNDPGIIRALIDAGARIRGCTSEEGDTPLTYAARLGHVEAFELLLNGGARMSEIGRCRSDGQCDTPLSVAQENGQWAILETFFGVERPDVSKFDWPDLTHPLRTGVRSPGDAAVVISVENYPLLDDQQRIAYATRDGDGFEQFLTYTAGVPVANLHRLKDRAATAEQIAESFEQALNEARGGTLWF